MGIEMKNPIIVGSSGLTSKVENIIEIEACNAGAVVLKSLFEEQILQESNKTYSSDEIVNAYPEAQDYIMNYSRDQAVKAYLNLIRESKKEVNIPVIASINCVTATEWISFARQIQEAGADGLELNVFILPSDPRKRGADNEKIYFDIVEKVLKVVQIPVAIKTSYYFSGLAAMALKLSWTGISGLVLFNRFFSPDIDIDKFEIKAGHVFSSPEELINSLRWVAMLSSRVHCDISASTGIHDGEAVIKQILAGARAVQVSSILYKKGFAEINRMIDVLNSWMKKHHFQKLEDFEGKMSIKEVDNPAAYERVQFMKYFSGIE